MKNIKKYNKKIVTIAIAVAMVFGMVVMVNIVTGSAFADEDYSEYNFLYEQLDPEFYANLYPDLKSIANDPYALWEHYWDHGMAEGRIPYAGAQPGEVIDGYKISDEELAAQAAARAAEEAAQAQAEAAARSQSIAAAQVGVGEYVYDYSVLYDLSDWTPEQMALLAQKQIEFDASGLIRAGSTESQISERLNWIRDNLYPEGTTVGICSLGAGKLAAALYGDDMYWLVGYDKNGKWVFPIGYLFTTTHTTKVNGDSIRDAKVGDILDTLGGSRAGHVQVVLSHDSKGITVVESNSNNDEKMHWGRRISWNELENGGKTIYQEQNLWGKLTHYNY